MWAVAKVVLTAVLVARVADGSHVLLESDEETEMKPRSRAVGGMHSGGKYLESRRRLSPSCLGVSPIGEKKHCDLLEMVIPCEPTGDRKVVGRDPVEVCDFGTIGVEARNPSNVRIQMYVTAVVYGAHVVKRRAGRGADTGGVLFWAVRTRGGLRSGTWTAGSATGN